MRLRTLGLVCALGTGSIAHAVNLPASLQARADGLRAKIDARRAQQAAAHGTATHVQFGIDAQYIVGGGISAGLASEHAAGRNRLSLVVTPRFRFGLGVGGGSFAEATRYTRQTWARPMPTFETRFTRGAALVVGAGASDKELRHEDLLSRSFKLVHGYGIDLVSVEQRANIRIPLLSVRDRGSRLLDRAARALDEADHASLLGDAAKVHERIGQAEAMSERYDRLVRP